MIELYKVSEINQTRFLKTPKELFENPVYNKALNSDAKLLYSLLLDRMELSRENNWVNENGEIYLLYTREDIQEMLGISNPTVTKAFNQLNKMELIKEIRQGLGKPNIIFVGKIKYPETIENTQKPNILISGYKKSLHQDTKIFCPNDTDCNKTENNELHHHEEDEVRVRARENPKNNFSDSIKELIKNYVKHNKIFKKDIDYCNAFDYYIEWYKSSTNMFHPKIGPDIVFSFIMKISLLDDPYKIYEMIDKFFYDNNQCSKSIQFFVEAKQT